jgi:hypothetical protein
VARTRTAVVLPPLDQGVGLHGVHRHGRTVTGLADTVRTQRRYAGNKARLPAVGSEVDVPSVPGPQPNCLRGIPFGWSRVAPLAARRHAHRRARPRCHTRRGGVLLSSSGTPPRAPTGRDDGG